MYLAKLKLSDLVLAAFVIGITGMLLVPLPTSLLDLFLVLNIAFAVILLLAGLYMPNALALLAFPALLLITTLYRLGLNVASTRLILSQGEAGQVIQAFGTFLIRGEIIVGIIIFAIITIVNFIVIAKGAVRVSEVAARFALDSLPGRQMEIDSELRAGMLGPEEAQRKRDDLRKECQLYGAMDGAMRFVQGDAIAGVFIIITNILGGMYMGIQSGMSFAEAVQTYTILTVGDGLVNQIPALLTSICAGIVVTRVSSGKNTSLGADVGSQFLSRPGTMVFSAVLLFFMGIISGIYFAFFVVGVVVLGTAYAMQRSATSEALLPATLQGGSAALSMLGGTSREEEALDDSSIVVSLDSAVLYRLYKQDLQQFRSWWQDFQRDFYGEVGLRLPDPKVVQDDRLPPSFFSFSIRGSLVKKAVIPADSLFVEVNPTQAEILGIVVSDEVEHPITSGRAFWARESAALRDVLAAGKIRSYDFMGYIALEIGAFCLSHPEEILSIADIHSYLKQIERKHPGFLAEILGQQVVGIPEIAQLMYELVKEGISVRDFGQIVESVAAFCSSHEKGDENSEFALNDLVSHVRTSRKRHLLSVMLSGRGTLKIVSLSGEVEELLEELNPSGKGRVQTSDVDHFRSMRAGLLAVLAPVKNRGVLPIAILCREELRRSVSRFLLACEEKTKIITYDELDPSITVEPVGVWGLL